MLRPSQSPSPFRRIGVLASRSACSAPVGLLVGAALALCVALLPAQIGGLVAVDGAEPSAGDQVPAAEPESIPEGVTLLSVEVWPEKMELRGPFDIGQVLITGLLNDGQQIDLTRMAQMASTPELVAVDSLRRVTPLGEGSEALVFQIAGHEVSVPVHVANVGQPVDISYVQDVQPSLSKMGCNQGTCHGSKDGKGGFKLSLRGYDYLFDHRALTDDVASRRFNRANPDQSLMLLKASGSIPHVGGVLTRPGERRYDMLKRWILQGAPLDLDAPRVTGIEVLPKDPILPRANMKQQMVVIASYSDGSRRDVTANSFVGSGNIEILAADKHGVVTSLRRGEAPVLARYEGAYAATTITVMGDRSGFQWADPPAYNYIDELVYDKLKRVKISPSPLCTDEEFIRRVYLDLTGLPPTADAVRAFLADPRPTRVKRDELVDQLVGNGQFVEYWTNKWADLLQVNRKYLGKLGAVALRNWIKDAIATNRPYDQFAYQVITGSGSTLDNPAAAYWKIHRDPASAMENTTQLFLAVRFNCNKCHDHPFERWTQDQYYHLTAYFAQVGLKPDPEFAGQKIGGSAVESAAPLVEVVYDKGEGEVTHDRTGQIAPPSFPYEVGSVSGQEHAARREQLARWITSADNRYFASSYANRLWGYLTGAGLIEPIDDIRAGNPPTNPRLLKALTEDFVQSGFDTQHMMRTICKSRVYQQSVATNRWNEDDQINYSHALPRRLPAEVLYDAIHIATGSVPKIPGVPAGFRAAQLPDSGVTLPFLDDFGRPPRESACECERSSGVALGPVMKLINGPTVNDAITDPENELAKLVASEPDDDRVIEEIFLQFLARRPTEQEKRFAADAMIAPQTDELVLRQALEEYRRDRLAKIDQWESTLPRPAAWQPVVPVAAESMAGADLSIQQDGSLFVSGKLDKDTYRVTLPSRAGPVTGIRLEAMADDRLPAKGPGRAKNGNFVLSELRVSLLPATKDADPQVISLASAEATFSQQGYDVSRAIDNNVETGWAISPQTGQSHLAFFTLAEPVTADSGKLLIELDQQHGDRTHAIGQFRLAVTDSPAPFQEADLPEEIGQIVRTPKRERSEAQIATLQSYFLNLDSRYKELTEAVELARQQAQEHRLTGVQDLAWALINTPSFLFNR